MMDYNRTKLNFAQSQREYVEDNKDNHKFKKILVGICFILLLIITFKGATAMDWHEQKNIAKEIGYKNNYDGYFRFAYYEEMIREDNVIYYADYQIYNDKPYYDSLITFYSYSALLDKHKFTCLILHEIGHYKEVKFDNGKRKTKLNESYADDYMQKQDKNCKRFYQ